MSTDRFSHAVVRRIRTEIAAPYPLWKLLQKLPWKHPWLPLAAVLVFAQLSLLGPLLLTPGIPKGGDMTLNLLSGYYAQDSSWHQIWDDSRFPGQPKNVSRFSLSDLAATWITQATGDVFLAVRLTLWAGAMLALAGMYLLVSRTTGSRAAGAAAALVFVFSRGATFRAVMPMVIGFALIPLVFLAVDRFLNAPSWRRALVLALTLALYATASIPAYTYILGLALAVYVIAFVVSRAVAHRYDRGVLRLFAKLGGFGLLGLGVTLALSAYFLWGLRLSTVPLVEESGGYTLDTVDSRLPTAVEALLFYRASFLFNTALMDVAIWMLVIAAVATPLLRVNYRVVALLVIGLGSAYFASDVTSPLYLLLYDNLPYFSLVRGPTRWMAMTLFAFSALLGIGLSAALEHWRSLARDLSRRAVVMRRASGVAAVALVGVAVINVWSQLPGLRQWFTPYQLSTDYTYPYLWLRHDASADSAFATTPFLAGRVRGEPFIDAVDFGKTLGPGLSGLPAFGVFRTGGLDVQSGVLDLVEGMSALPTRQHEQLSVPDAPLELWTNFDGEARPLTDFVMSGRLRVREIHSPDGFVQVQFRKFTRDSAERYYALDIYPDSGRTELRRVGGRNPAVLASAVAPVRGKEEFDVRLEMRGDLMTAWVDGNLLATATASNFPRGDVAVAASGVQAVFDSLELSRVRQVQAPDYSLARLLGLFNVRYFVVQPHTAEVERRVISDMPGLHELHRWGRSVVYENHYHIPGKAYFAPSFAVFVGDAASVVHGLYQLDPLARSKVPLIGLEDIPESLHGQLLGAASFIAIDGNHAQASIAMAQVMAAAESAGVAEVPPLLYTWDVSDQGGVVSRPATRPGPATLSSEPRSLGQGKNFVLETTLSAQRGFAEGEHVTVRFRVRSEANYYQAHLDPAGGYAAIDVRGGNLVRNLNSATFESVRERPITVRLAAIDSRFTLFVNGEYLLQVEDATYDKGGPILIFADGEVQMSPPRLVSAGGDAPALFGVIAESGFESDQVAGQLASITPDELGQLSYSQSYAATLDQVPTGRYRVIAGAVAPQAPVLELGLRNGQATAGFRLREPLTIEGSGPAKPASSLWLFISPPVDMSEGEVRIALATQSVATRLIAVMLVEAPEGAEDGGVLAAILRHGAASPLELERASATEYSGPVPASDGGIVVFKEGFHQGWRAALDGAPLAQVPAFGSLNAYWLPEGQDAELRLTFAPQRRYQRAMMVSGLSFLAVMAALLAPYGWQRARRLKRARWSRSG